MFLRKLLTISTIITYVCTAQTSTFQLDASNFFTISKMNFQKQFCSKSISILKFDENLSDFRECFQNWKTIWIFAEFVAKFCELLEISETELIIHFSSFLNFQFIFSIHSLNLVRGVFAKFHSRYTREPLLKVFHLLSGDARLERRLCMLI